MGYPMTYRRCIERNSLGGGYDAIDANGNQVGSMLKGDLRRVERDALDRNHLLLYSRYAGITTEQARKVLTAFFDDADEDFIRWQREEMGELPWEAWPDDGDGPFGPVRGTNDNPTTAELEGQLRQVW